MLKNFLIPKRQIVLTALIVTLGMQSLRLVYPLAVWHQPSTIYYLYFVLTLSFFTPIIIGVLKPRYAGLLLFFGLALSRFAEIVSHTATIDLWASLIGVGIFMLTLPLLFRMRPGESSSISGLGLGLALDSLIHGTFWTNNLGAEGSIGALLIMAGLILSTCALAWIEFADITNPLQDRTWGSALLLVLIGPFIFLQLIALQNHGFVSTLNGVTLPQAVIIISFGNLAMLAGMEVGSKQRQPPMYLTILASLVLLVSILRLNDMQFLVLPLVQVIFGWTLARITRASTFGKANYLIPSSISLAIGQALMLILFLISFGHLIFVNSLPKGITLPVVGLTCVGILIAADIRARKAQIQPNAHLASLVHGLGILLLSGFALLLSRPSPLPSNPPALPVGVMTYNIHSAVSHEFGQDPKAIAQVIRLRSSDPIIIFMLYPLNSAVFNRKNRPAIKFS